MIKKVLVYTYGDQKHDQTIKAAAAFAALHGAELTGLFVRPDTMGYTTVYGSYPLNLAQAFFDLQSEFAERIKSRFTEIVAGYDCRSQWHEVDQYEKQPRPAFYADYIFVSQPDTESSVVFNDTDFVDLLITSTGLPTIVIPREWQSDDFAKKPLLGWKETREAVGAVRHSLPLMRNAGEVDIVTVTRKTDLEAELVQGIEISEYLSEHGVDCKFFAERMIESDKNETSTLLRHADTNGCDLIIIGGYGHSRFREIVLGGVTRELIRTSTIPVLLSH